MGHLGLYNLTFVNTFINKVVSKVILQCFLVFFHLITKLNALPWENGTKVTQYNSRYRQYIKKNTCMLPSGPISNVLRDSLVTRLFPTYLPCVRRLWLCVCTLFSDSNHSALKTGSLQKMYEGIVTYTNNNILGCVIGKSKERHRNNNVNFLWLCSLASAKTRLKYRHTLYYALPFSWK